MSALSREQIVAIDKRHVWHPYTEMTNYRENVDPLVIVSAAGSRLTDADGRSYIDANASWWTAALGHCHPRLVDALTRQTGELCHTALGGMIHPRAVELAERLAQVTPAGLEHLFYADNGSTAIEVAMKLALQYWHQNGRPQRTTFVSLEGAFHGDTIGTSALGGVEVFRKPFASSLADCIHVPSPGMPGQADLALSALEEVISTRSETLAAVVLESLVQGANGMRIYSPDFLVRARELCDQFDVFLILDEVFTGYGRTGKMWASEHAGISPDMQCMAKGFSGGMLPMAGTICTQRIFDGFLGSPDRAFYYGHTFCGNPLGAAIAIEVLRVFEEEETLAGVETRSERIAEAFGEMASWDGIARTRSLGMIGALDFEGDEGYLADVGWRVYREALKRGVYMRPLGNVIYVTPPLNIPEADLEELLSTAQECVALVTEAL